MSDDVPRGRYLGKRQGPAGDEVDHFGQCPLCGAWVDRRDLGAVIGHQGPLPHAADPPLASTAEIIRLVLGATRRPWTDVEDSALLIFDDQRFTLEEIAAELDRTPEEVLARIEHLKPRAQ